MEVKAINCPNCGSANVVMDSDTSAHCKNCNSKFKIQKDEPAKTVLVTNKLVVDESGNRPVPLLNLAATDVTDETQFLRAALIGLSEGGKIPADVYEADFQPVKTETDCFLMVKTNVDVSYHASIGYDRQVTERVYDSAAKEYKTKTKTVTDWSPLSGKATYDMTGEAVLRSSVSDKLQHIFDFKSVESNAKLVPFEDSTITDEPEKPTAEDFTYAEEVAMIGAKSHCERDLPGDHVKDFSASTVCNTYETAVVSARDMILDFDYKGEKCQLRGFTSLSSVRKISTPSDYGNVKGSVGTKQRPFEIAALSLFSFNIFLAFLMMILSSAEAVSRGAKAGVLITFCLIGVAYFVFFCLYRKKLVKDYSTLVQNAKVTALEKILNEKKLEPLSYEEKSALSNTSSTISDVKRLSSPSKAITILFGLSVFFSLAFLIF